MKKVEIMKIALKMDKKNNNVRISKNILKTYTREIVKNAETGKVELSKVTIESNKKKKRVSFIDQIQSKKEIAQIIYINDKVSLNQDKKDTPKYLEQYRKQGTNISDSSKKDDNIYKIKRPKKSLFKKINKDDSVNEQCTCNIF